MTWILCNLPDELSCITAVLSQGHIVLRHECDICQNKAIAAVCILNSVLSLPFMSHPDFHTHKLPTSCFFWQCACFAAHLFLVGILQMPSIGKQGICKICTKNNYPIYRYSVRQKIFTPLNFLQLYFSTTKNFKTLFYVHIRCSNLHQITNFYSVILNFN